MAERPEEGARTEEPTPRRLALARRHGEVAVSRELTAAVGLAAMFLVLVLGAPRAVGRLVGYLRGTFSRAATAGAPATVEALAVGLGEAAAALGLLLAVGALVAAVTGLATTGGLFTAYPLRLDPARVLPRASRVVSGAALVDLARGVAKILLFALIAWWTLAAALGPVVRLTGASAGGILAALGAITGELGLRLVLAAAAVGVADQLWQRHRHLRALRMTREEVRRELKETEGDPQHKAERLRLHRELLEQRMLSDIRKADFVVVNPEHIAVALRYDRSGDAAPMVVAKGERLLAERIKEVAREAGVPIFRDVTLARALDQLEAGDEIPEALYEAVAEILRVVYGTPPAPPRAPPGAPPPGAADPGTGFWRRA